MSNWGSYIMPVVVAVIIIVGMIKKGPVFDWFVEGAMDGFRSLFSIAPFLLGMFVAIGAFRASGAMEWLSRLLAPVFKLFNIPGELSTFILIRPLSGNGALAVLADIFTRHGPDSDIGRMASLMMGSTETIFYTLCVYMGAAGLKKGSYAIPAALMAAFPLAY
ncbi:MAG TPA: nucleoside recognition domain-containing protein, partial [Clostridia bacterium]|nr:nucleoside recognition domain-containing protein [Clostridia bacterium]